MQHSPSKKKEKVFEPFGQSMKYPKLVQKYLTRKNMNLNRAVEILRTPSRQFAKKEIHRLSELAKSQHNDFDLILSQSCNKKNLLLDEEKQIKSELSKKDIEIENPILDIKSIFTVPSKPKKRRRENEFILLKLHSDNDYVMQEQAVSMFEIESAESISFDEILKSTQELSHNEPETLFKEINNINFEGKEYCESDGLSFTQERSKSELKSELCDKENELLGDEFMEVEETRTPYIPPSFAKVFGD